MAKDLTGLHPDTIAVRAGVSPTNEGEHSTPIFTTSSFLFDSAAQAAARFDGSEEGNIYSRFTNPTVRVFEDRLASLEKGDWCVATASGMAAVSSLCLSLLQAGDHLVASRSLFGTIVVWLETYMPRYGIEVTLVSLTDLDEWQAAIKDNTKLLFVETPSNPTTEVVDIQALAAVGKAKNVPLAVDNCFCTPALQLPLELGADYVVHSATKYLDGQGRCIGGAIVGRDEEAHDTIKKYVRTAGPTLSPFNAWAFIKGMETLRLRMEAQCANALKVAEWLNQQDIVEHVYYPGLKTHPNHEIAKKQQKAFGAIVSFVVKGGQDAAWKVIDSTELVSITANLGDTRTTITHPATTTHGRVPAEQKQKAGIVDGLIRVAVGLEHPDDVIADLQKGLSA